MDNPYAGTEWEASWQEGHDAGLAQPSGTVDPPAVLEPNQAQIYSEGFLAGQQDATDHGTPVEINPMSPEEPEDGKAVELAATAVFAFGGWALEWAKAGMSGGIAVAVHLLISIGIPAGAPSPDLSDPAELAGAMNASIRGMGATDLYLPFCQSNQHSAQGDQVTEQGFWHGNVFTDYWGAYPAAEEHLSNEPDALGQVGLLHAKADSDGVEWIELA